MVMYTRIGFALAAGAALIAVVALQVAAGESDVVDRTEQAKATWNGNCAKCHAAPDAGFEADRAFLQQIMETT